MSGPSELVPAQPLHRLNRLEYNNTVRDLLGTELRPADAFPPDPELDGFDNMAEALALTPALLDGYYSAARIVVDDALDPHPAFAVFRRYGDRATAVLDTEGGYAVGDLWALSGGVLTLPIDAPEGNVTVTLMAGATQVGAAPAPALRFELDGVEVQTFVVQGTGAMIAPHVHQLTLTAGSHTLRYVPTNFVSDPVGNNGNDVLLRSLAIESEARVDGPGRERVFVCDPSAEADGCYAEILETFARRAWRRPLSETERSRLTRLWSNIRDGGESDDQAMRLVMREILSSANFIYRARTVRDADDRGWLDNYVLASRLSYFLWSSTPDERLLAAAAAGSLASEEGMADAVGWMLDDERAQGLIDGFAEQWLSTRMLALASPNPDVYPSFDEELRQSMVLESKAFFADFLRERSPVIAMLRPGFTYLNDRLAEHYGMEPVGTDELVRVSSPALARSGILSLGAWLTAVSDPNRSSPIRRGRWLSDKILCEPVSPPPAGLMIPPLSDAEGSTVREQLEQHRSDPFCASCHSHLDVLGMGFEAFDGIGHLRADEGLDTLGELPDGQTFEGANEMAALVDKQAFARCVSSKLLVYALGRRLGDEDVADLDAIAERAVVENLTLRDVIVAVVTAPAFRSPGRMQEEAR